VNLAEALRAPIVWDPAASGDTNLADLFAYARHIELACGPRLAGASPSIPEGVSVVECIETSFVSG
jgi:hypothetical protein